MKKRNSFNSLFFTYWGRSITLIGEKRMCDFFRLLPLVFSANYFWMLHVPNHYQGFGKALEFVSRLRLAMLRLYRRLISKRTGVHLTVRIARYRQHLFKEQDVFLQWSWIVHRLATCWKPHCGSSTMLSVHLYLFIPHILDLIPVTCAFS